MFTIILIAIAILVGSFIWNLKPGHRKQGAISLSKNSAEIVGTVGKTALTASIALINLGKVGAKEINDESNTLIRDWSEFNSDRYKDYGGSGWKKADANASEFSEFSGIEAVNKYALDKLVPRA